MRQPSTQRQAWVGGEHLEDGWRSPAWLARNELSPDRVDELNKVYEGTVGATKRLGNRGVVRAD